MTTFDETPPNDANKDVKDAEGADATTDTVMTDGNEASAPAEGQKTEDDQGPTGAGHEGQQEAGQHETEKAQYETEKATKPAVSEQKEDKEKQEEEEGVDLNKLYPMFWSLQAYFSAPTKVFDPQYFASFKAGLEATLSIFRGIKTEDEGHTNSKALEDMRRATKRRRTSDGQEFSAKFNPKYLTSRDLFGLEVSIWFVVFSLHLIYSHPIRSAILPLDDTC